MMEYAKKMAETLMARFPDPDTYPFASWTYPQGFMLWGIIRLYERTGDPVYLDYVRKYGEEHVSGDGSVAGWDGGSMDDMMPGSVLAWLYHETREEKYLLACRRIYASFADYPRNPDGGFWHGRGMKGQMWVDGVFMGQMFMLHYALYTGEEKEACFAECIRQLTVVYDRCNKDGSGLLYHAYCEGARAPWANRLNGKSTEVWSEGLGWYAMILAEALAIIPKDFPGYDRILRQGQILCRDLDKVQDKTSGLWLQVVDKNRHPGNWQDSSGSAMFLYSLKRLQDLGIVTGYEKAIELAWRGLRTKMILNAEGYLDVWDACDGLGVQRTYDEYIGFLKTVNAKEAVAAAFWAAEIMERD
ncbi:MAG: glycoside hydrolase family 88 protein [Firmicutes bacterium]|nr:glycoside hydrolase family 88 protein [Bacillota bacterium]